MTVAAVQTATAANTSGNPVTLNFGTALTPGNRIAIFDSYRGGLTVTPPAGLTADTAADDGTQAGNDYQRLVQSGDGSSYVFTPSGDMLNLVGLELSGLDPATPYHSTGWGATNADPASTVAQLTPASDEANGYVFAAIGVNNSSLMIPTANTGWAALTAIGTTAFHKLYYTHYTGAITPGTPIARPWHENGDSDHYAAITLLFRAAPTKAPAPVLIQRAAIIRAAHY